jgi:hypothetical protein
MLLDVFSGKGAGWIAVKIKRTKGVSYEYREDN